MTRFQWQWKYACGSFYGEVILKGATNPTQTPTASFYYPSHPDSSIREFRFDYSLVVNATGNLNSHVLVLGRPLDPSFPRPDILAVSYDRQEISAYCDDGLCAFGNYTIKPYLSFKLQDSHTGAITQLRAFNKEWEFSDDAPSTELHFQMPDGKLVGTALKSAVTQRNHCETLKVCLSSRTPDLATLAPLGVLLMSQTRFADYCSRPRMYSI